VSFRVVAWIGDDGQAQRRLMKRRVVTLIAVTVVLPLALAGCMSGERDADDMVTTDREAEAEAATERELLARVSAVTRTLTDKSSFDWVAYADLAGAREQLGLPEDAAIRGQGNKRRLLSSFAARPLFRFEPGFWANPRLGAFGEVLATGEIEIAVSTSRAFSGPGAGEILVSDALVVRTRQPFDEIADRLQREHGYEEADDGVLIGSDPIDPDDLRIAPVYDGVPFPAVGHTAGGVVVFGGSARAVRAALDGADAELTPAAELLSRLPGVSRVAKGRLGAPCVLAFGLSEDAVPREGRLIAAIDGKARAEHMLLAGLTSVAITEDAEVAHAEATAKGRWAQVRFTSTDRANATRLAVEDVEEPYSCP
jgi:hypothetical protein